MLTVVVVASVVTAVVSLPWWLPGRVVALRVRVFARIDGGRVIPVPGDLVGVERFKEVYSHPEAGGRSKGAALSDLFWYWLSPGAEIHQEHLEAGERYDAVARATRDFLAVPRTEAEELTRRCVTRALWDSPDLHQDARSGRDGPRLVRLRDLTMPVWAEFYYELVFGRPCPQAARDLIVGNADDVVTALKCCGLRHMERRHRLTRYLADHLSQVRCPLPVGLSPMEQALYLQGTFFNTAVVQMSEAMTHLLMVLAQHPVVQATALTRDARYLDQVIAETLRLYPLFGIAHRITTGDIELGERTTIPAGSVLCFNYPEFHRTGFTDPGRFDPARFDHPARSDPSARVDPARSGHPGGFDPSGFDPGRSDPGRSGHPGGFGPGQGLERPGIRDMNHIPFGVAANRPCPAWRLAPITMRVAAQEILQRHALLSSASHTRSLPNRGPCLLIPRAGQGGPGRAAHRPTLLYMRLRDRWEDVWRSLVQLALGTYMIRDARRLRPCERHFASADADRPAQEDAGDHR